MSGKRLCVTYLPLSIPPRRERDPERRAGHTSRRIIRDCLPTDERPWKFRLTTTETTEIVSDESRQGRSRPWLPLSKRNHRSPRVLATAVATNHRLSTFIRKGEMVPDESPFAGYNKIADENYRGTAASLANNYATRIFASRKFFSGKYTTCLLLSPWKFA